MAAPMVLVIAVTGVFVDRCFAGRHLSAGMNMRSRGHQHWRNTVQYYPDLC